MRVSAILVVNDRPGISYDGRAESWRVLSKGAMVCAEIMGQSLLEKMVARLLKAGVSAISIIGGPSVPSLPRHRNVEVTVADNSFARWLAAQQTLRQYGTRGMDTVVVIGLGAYLEFDVAETLKAHLSTGASLTQLEDVEGPLDLWVVNSRWFRTAATGCKLPFRYGEFPGLPVSCPMTGYVNRLTDAQDLRRLVVDAFSGRCEVTPAGREVRPGVWLDEGARVHKLSRLVAPVYIGRGVTVEASAVVTRFTNLERNCRIGEGTVVEESTVLPHTAMGRCLDVANAVVDGSQFADLTQSVTFQIEDAHLLLDIAPRNWRSPMHRRFSANVDQVKDDYKFDYSHYWSRAADRLSGVFFKG